MSLTDAQIDRYSRQIIVPHIGGGGQERLLAARILLVGDVRDIEAPLAYLVGAGVGSITVKSAGIIEVIAAMRELNPDVTVTDELKAPVDLALLLVGTEAARKVADEIAKNRDAHAMVIARLDAPGKIFVVPDPQSRHSFDPQFGIRSEGADFIAMLATAEAFKLIAGYAENPSRTTIDFEGYETRIRVNP
jgi:hypothetical protein